MVKIAYFSPRNLKRIHQNEISNEENNDLGNSCHSRSTSAHAVRRLIINLSYSLGIARYSFDNSIANCANICLCSVAKLTGNIFIEFGLMLCLLLSQFSDSLNATFIKLTAALSAPSTKNHVFQCFLYKSKQRLTIS